MFTEAKRLSPQDIKTGAMLLHRAYGLMIIQSVEGDCVDFYRPAAKAPNVGRAAIAWLFEHCRLAFPPSR